MDRRHPPLERPPPPTAPMAQPLTSVDTDSVPMAAVYIPPTADHPGVSVEPPTPTMVTSADDEENKESRPSSANSKEEDEPSSVEVKEEETTSQPDQKFSI